MDIEQIYKKVAEIMCIITENSAKAFSFRETEIDAITQLILKEGTLVVGAENLQDRINALVQVHLSIAVIYSMGFHDASVFKND